MITDFLISIENNAYTSIKNIGDFDERVFKAKILLNPKILKEKKYYLRLKVEKEYVKSSSMNYILKDDLLIYEISIDSPTEIILDLDYKNSLPILQLDIFTPMEYEYIFKNEKLIFGLAYGIMFCALLYNLAFYYFNKDRSFLYYSLLQMSSITLLLIISLPIKLFYFVFQYLNIFDFTVDLVIVFSLLFTINFLNTKKQLPKIHILLSSILILTCIDMILIFFYEETILYNYIATFFPLGVMVGSAFFAVRAGNKPAVFYIIGWMVLFVCVFLVDTDIFDVNDNYMMHFAFPVEALVFSFALGYKMKLIEVEKQKNEQLLIHQSRLASMGEMVANIAHQWRQPLTHLSYAHMNLKTAYDQEKLSGQYFDKKTKEINEQIEFMSHTIDDFSNFFKTDKKMGKFGVLNTFEKTHRLLTASFKHNSIEVVVLCEKEFYVNSNENEFSQVLFNILNNAKQELIEKRIAEPIINVQIQEDKKNVILTICDNALGIDEKIIDKIFLPYFTTKDSGMGIGLYMSKVIIEQHMNGTLKVENIPNGVLFEICLPKS
ncbi:MAG: sensor histidine kinase [Campylobacteraceae bacterium]|nr:sensor histidine kinase [Campylobacteraceae bacterium]